MQASDGVLKCVDFLGWVGGCVLMCSGGSGRNGSGVWLFIKFEDTDRSCIFIHWQRSAAAAASKHTLVGRLKRIMCAV